MEYRWNKNWAAKYIAGVTDKKILVVNDFQLALKLSQNNSVTYLTDDHDCYYDFLEMVSPLNNVNFWNGRLRPSGRLQGRLHEGDHWYEIRLDRWQSSL